MYANNLKRISTITLACLLLVAPVTVAAQETSNDEQRLNANDEFKQTLDARCTICHTRQRIDTAQKQGEDLDALMQRMIEQGAELNERDKSVLGTFWGKPTK
ncbi:MAG: hypothetical protein OET90_03000 [Desulfuromonadales bacterium]|nr:hypothetical protein [Desulfuromonadales bacterium]